MRFMQTDVMPWARVTLGPIKGGAGPGDVRRRATAAVPKRAAGGCRPSRGCRSPRFERRGWEQYSCGMDAQMRNAIYGYLAESDKQATAAYMREVVMPGMARLLHRPPYDFTKPYDYNRSRFAFGCYHCHRVN